MNEAQPIPSKFLGITEEQYKNVRVPRRTMLQVPFVIALNQLVVACGSPRRPEPAPPRK